MPDLYKFTSIGRVLDPKYPTNLAIMIATALAGVIAGGLRLVTTGDLGAGIMAGIYMGAAVFIAWAIAREADPDHPYSAFFAAAAAFGLMLLWGGPAQNLVFLAAMIVYLRMINRVVGPPFRWIDTLGACFFVILLALRGREPLTMFPAWASDAGAILLLAAAFLLDGILSNPLRRHLLFSGLAAAVGLWLLTTRGVSGNFSMENLVFYAALVASSLLIVTMRDVRTMADAPGYALAFDRVRAAMGWVLLIGVCAALFWPLADVQGIASVWGVLAGVPLYALASRFIPALQPAAH